MGNKLPGPNSIRRCGTVLRDQICQVLRNHIISGEIPQGARLGEVLLASELNVSRTPLREGLRQLVEEGLVEYLPHRGVRVITPTRELVIEVFQIREALEGVAAREAAMKIDPANLAEIRRRFDQLRLSVLSGDLSDVGDFLHGEILRAAGNRTLARLMSIYTGQVRWFQSLASRIPGRLVQAYREHESILTALESRDPDWAQSVASAHVRNTLADLLPRVPSLEDLSAKTRRRRLKSQHNTSYPSPSVVQAGFSARI